MNVLQKKMMNDSVTIIIPVRNELHYIQHLLDSVINNNYPKKLLQILVIDGISDDGTREIISFNAKQHNYIQLVDNPHKTVPHAMNIGIKKATGEIIIRLDAHAIYPSNYISSLVYYSKKLGADNVGGVWVTMPANDTMKAIAIAELLAHPFGVGNSEYRINSKDKEYLEVDTVPFGCFNKKIFDQVGLYDEDLIRNQDNELNERILNATGKIYLIPAIKIQYFARENFTKLSKMFFQYAYFGPLVDIKLNKATRMRRYIPTIFVLSLLLPMLTSFWSINFLYISALSIGLHTLVNAGVAVQISLARKKFLFPFLMIGFLISHLSYGFGYLKGALDFYLLSKHTKNKSAISLSR